MSVAVDLLINAAESAQTLGDLKKAGKDLKNILVSIGDESSPEFIKAAKAAAAVKDRIEEMNEEIEKFNPDKFGSLDRIARGAAAGVSLVSGAMSLLGADSEETQKALLKVQAAMQFAQGLQGLDDLKKGFNELYKVIVANPILAVTTALLALGIAAYKVYQAYQDTHSAAAMLTKELEKQEKVTEQLSNETDRQIKLLEAQGGSETEIYNLKQKLIAQKIKEAEIAIELHKTKLQEIQDNDTLYESYLKVALAIFKKIGMDEKANEVEKLIQANKRERGEEDQKALNEQIEKLKDLQNEKVVNEIKFTKFQAEEGKKRKEQAEKDLKEIEAAQIAADEAEFARLAKLMDAHIDYLNSLKSETEKSIDAINGKKEEDLATQQQLLDEKLISEEEYWANIMAIEEKASDDIIAINQKVADNAKAIADKRKKEQEAQDKADAADRQKIKDQELASAASLLGSLSSLAGKNAKIQKGFAVSQATINTFQGASKALAEYGPTPVGFLAMAAAIAAGLVQVRNILKTNPSESGGGGGDIGGVGSGIEGLRQAPAGSQPTGELDADGNVQRQANNQQPIRAYMVESQASEVMDRVDMIENMSRFQ